MTTPLTANIVIGVDNVTYTKLNNTISITTTPYINPDNYYGNVNIAIDNTITLGISCFTVSAGNTISSFTNSGIILGGGGAGGPGNPNKPIPASNGGDGFLNNGTITTFYNSGAFLGGGGGGNGGNGGAPGGAGGGGGGGNRTQKCYGGSIVGYYTMQLTNGKASTADGEDTNNNERGAGGGGPGGKGGNSISNLSAITFGGTGGGAIGGYGGSQNGNGYNSPVNSVFIFGGGGGGGGTGAGGAGGYGMGSSGDYASGAGGGGGIVAGYSTGGVYPSGGYGGYSINNTAGTIRNLYNAQGGTGYLYGPLFYKGNLPTNYYIIINSASRYGQLYGPVGGIAELANFNIDPTSNIPFGTTTFARVIYGYTVSNSSVSGEFQTALLRVTWNLTRSDVSYTQSNNAGTIQIAPTAAYNLTVTSTYVSFSPTINNVNSPATYTTLTGSYSNLSIGISNSSLIRPDTTSLYLNNVLTGVTPATFNGTFTSNGNTYAWQLLVVPNSNPITYNLVIILSSMLSGIYINNIDMAFLFKTSF